MRALRLLSTSVTAFMMANFVFKNIYKYRRVKFIAKSIFFVMNIFVLNVLVGSRSVYLGSGNFSEGNVSPIDQSSWDYTWL